MRFKQLAAGIGVGPVITVMMLMAIAPSGLITRSRLNST